MWNRDFNPDSSESEESYESPPESLRYFTPIRNVPKIEQPAASSFVTSPPYQNLVSLEESKRTLILEEQRAKLKRKEGLSTRVLRNDFSQPIFHPVPKLQSNKYHAEELDEEVLDFNEQKSIQTVQEHDKIPIKPENQEKSENNFHHVLKPMEDTPILYSEENPEEEKEPPRVRTVKEIILMKLIDRKKFLTTPVPKGITVQCTIKRNRSGFSRFYPKYYMHLSDGWEFLAAAKKRTGNRTSNYLITMNKSDFSKKSMNFLAKLRSNFMGTEFHIYNNGLNPKNKKATLTNTRQELGGILYNSTIFKNKGPRKIRMVMPDVNENDEQAVWKPRDKKDGIISRYKEGKTQGMKCYYNKPPNWNERLQSFVLNFNGRVDCPSVKNFILVDEEDESTQYFLFGRIGEHHFNLDFAWPLSPIQAFGIALSSLDNKFACE